MIVLQRGSEQFPSKQVYLSSGIHGDEPAGPQALLDLLREHALPAEFNYTIFPVLNPAGLEAGTRESPAGIDLNRDYQLPESTEIQQQLTWIEQTLNAPIHLSMHLHEDWESSGFYHYELNFTDHPGFSPQMQAAARTVMPIETATEIDGLPAQNGLIRPPHMPVVEEGLPEALYIKQQFAGLNYTIETPSSRHFRERVDTQKAVILAALDTLRKDNQSSLTT